ncbi:hypothetical protein [Nonomuraea endophytica]|uniref:hypothetical protein n=1 Tax=Nonomuraea endophytica TaxID=714136 RepID=UPI0037C6174E
MTRRPAVGGRRDALPPTSGRAGHAVERDVWWSSTDIDLAKILPADDVEVLQVLEEISPWLAEAIEPAHTPLVRRWAVAKALMEHVAGDATATLADRVAVHSHRQEVTRSVQHALNSCSRAQRQPEPQLLRLAAAILAEVVQQGASGYPWDTEATGRVAADLHATAADPDPDPERRRERLWAAEQALSTALQVDGMVSLDARLDPRERKHAELKFGERLAAVIAADQAAQRAATPPGPAS